MVFDLDAAWGLHPQVAVRPEPFGALLYHFGTRRLSFLKQPGLTAVVQGLQAASSARDACVAGDVEATRDVVAALSTLAATGMIVRRDA